MKKLAVLAISAFTLFSCAPLHSWELGKSYIMAGNFCTSKDSADAILNSYQDKGFAAANMVADDLRQKKTNGDRADCFYSETIRAVLLEYFRTVQNLEHPDSEEKITVHLFKVRGSCGEYFTLAVDGFEKRR